MRNRHTMQFAPVDPVSSGLRGRCPRCGKGRLFNGYIKVNDKCGWCELDYGFADAGDGPAVFVIMIIGFIVVALALWAELAFTPPLWLHLVIWIPLAILLCFGKPTRAKRCVDQHAGIGTTPTRERSTMGSSGDGLLTIVVSGSCVLCRRCSGLPIVLSKVTTTHSAASSAHNSLGFHAGGLLRFSVSCM